MWLTYHYLIKEGYSFTDIEEMSMEHYEFISELVIYKKKTGKENPFTGGI